MILSCLKNAIKSLASTNGLVNNIRSISTNETLRIHLTPGLYAEPLKKKKRLDPAIIRAREEKRKRRLEKQIRRLEKSSRQLKPIDECEIPIEILNESKRRIRKPPKISEEKANERALLLKQWSSYRYRQYLNDIQNIDRIVLAQQWALDELKSENLELYNAAIQIDEALLPFQATGPVETPPIPDYDSPDGEYVDTSRKWD